MRELDNLLKEVKDLYGEFEDQRRERVRLARRARKLANKVQKQMPDMHLPEDSLGLGLHEKMEEVARTLYLPGSSQDDSDSIHVIGFSFDALFAFMKRLASAPWLDPLGDPAQ